MIFCRGVFLSMLILAATGCQQTQTVNAEPESGKSSAIIIVPGFKGTALARADSGERVWVTAGEALSGNDTLAWNDPGLDLAGALNLKPDGLLNTVRIIPGLFSIDVYGSLTAELHKRFASDAEIVEFAYDWRTDPLGAVQALGALVSSLHARGASVSIVAHSFGGYIAAYYLRYGAQDQEHTVETWQGARQVDHVVFMGTPFLGAMVKFRDMHTGETVGMNTTLLDATAHSSFPSSYFLLPAPSEPFFVSPQSDSPDLSLYDTQTWRDHGWGLFGHKDSLSPSLVGGRLKFLSLYLDRAARFSRLVNAPPDRLASSPLNILHIVGHGRTTLARATIKDHTLTFEASEDGDGTVTARSAEVPAAYRQAAEVTTIETTAAHPELWKEKSVEEQIVRFLSRRGENHSPRLGESVPARSPYAGQEH